MRFISPVVPGLLLLWMSLPGSSARELFWAGAAGRAADAGGGAWDENTSASWRAESPAGLLVRWSQHAVAVFAGSKGGEIEARGSLSTDGLVFPREAGAFVIRAGGELKIGGAGIRCESPAEQTLDGHAAILRFTDRASAAEGAEGDRVRIVSDGLMIFDGTSTAGRARLDSSGELQFTQTSSAGLADIYSTGQISFAGSATAARATIVSSGLLAFQDGSTSGSASITNRGLLTVEGLARLEGASLANTEAATLNVTAAHSPDGVRLASLTNAADATIQLGSQPLRVANLHLARGNLLGFYLSAKGTGSLQVERALVIAPGAEATQILIQEIEPLPAAQTIPLLDWSAAAYVSGAEAGHFVLRELPPGRSGRLRITARRLVLELDALNTR